MHDDKSYIKLLVDPRRKASTRLHYPKFVILAQQFGGGPHMKVPSQQTSQLGYHGRRRKHHCTSLPTAYLSGVALFLFSLQPMPRD